MVTGHRPGWRNGPGDGSFRAVGCGFSVMGFSFVWMHPIVPVPPYDDLARNSIVRRDESVANPDAAAGEDLSPGRAQPPQYPLNARMFGEEPPPCE
jgi:hypothetical protein